MKKILLTGLGDKLGGTESFIRVLIDGLKDEFDFSILAATNAAYAMKDFLEAAQVPVYQLQGIFGLKSVLKRGKLLDAFFASHDFDLVHINANTINAAYIAKAAQRAGIAVIFQVHNAKPSGYPWYAKALTEANKKREQRYLASQKMTLLSVSEEAARLVYGDQLTKSRVQVVENGIDTTRFNFNLQKRLEIRRQLAIAAEARVAIVIARLTPIKNIERSIQLFGASRPALLDELVIVGAGPELAHLQTVASQLPEGKGDHVIFAGQHSNTQDYLFAADVFFATSIAEGLSISVVEAQAAGLPVLASTGIPKLAGVTKRAVYTPLSEADNVWLAKLAQFDLHDFDQRLRDNEQIAKSKFSADQFLSRFRALYLHTRQ